MIDARGQAALETLASRLRPAKRITVLTGAGVSAASGVPTFRGAGGLWKSFRPETLATPEAFAGNPTLVWEWYDWRRSTIASCSPNPAHEVLARWSERPGFTLITQNVDGLHERAGTHDVVRMHGSIWHLQCASSCGGSHEHWEDRRVPLPDLPPSCVRCGGPARPAVVWFGEALDPEILERSIDATSCDVFLSVGTSSVVYPAAGLSAQAKAQGAFTAEINPEPSDGARHLDLAIALPAEIALTMLDASRDLRR